MPTSLKRFEKRIRTGFARNCLWLLMLLLVVNVAQAQTITTVESRCVNNGQIIIAGVVGSGGPYQLALVSYPAGYTPGPNHFQFNLPDTFSSLLPGNYTLQVVDQAGAVFNYPGVNVAGTYVLPGNDDYQPVATGVSNCSFANGSITGILSGGRAPYTYRIIAGPAQVGTSNTTGNFNGLVSGNYQVQAADSCFNVQTRNVVVSGYSASLSVTGANIRLINCTTFSLDTIFVNPGFPVGGRFEVINLNGSGGNVIRASGTSFPVQFTLFAKNDVPQQRVRIRVFDACGNSTLYVPLQFSNVADVQFTGATINKVSCDSLSLDGLTITPGIQPGFSFTLTNTNPGPLPTVYRFNSLPIRFKASRDDLLNGKVTIRIIDTCGDLVRSYAPRIIANDWNFRAVLKSVCSGVIVDSVNIDGAPLAPVTIKIKAFFSNGSGGQDSTNTQLITSLPYTVQGIPFNAKGLQTIVTVVDGCGDILTQANGFSFELNVGSLLYHDCMRSAVRLIKQGTYSLPIRYTVSPALAADNFTGNFNLPDGTYTFTAIDSCGRTASTEALTISRGWTISRAEQLRLCTPGFITNRIAVPARSFGQLTIQQYAGGSPVNSNSVLVSEKVFNSTLNRCVTCPVDGGTSEWIQFDSTLPSATYTYVVQDSCGITDTVTLVNDSTVYGGFFRETTVKSKCINKGDIIARWNNDGPASNNITVEVYNESGSQIIGLATTGNSNLTSYPNGQTLLTDYGPCMYVVKYSFSECDAVYADTVSINLYVQPTVNTVQSQLSCGGGSNQVIITGGNGVSPYTYQVVNATPNSYTTSPQTSPVFNLPGSQATVTVRLLDACLNSTTRTIAVTRSAAPYIRSNPAVFAACSLPFGFSLFTDSLYAGSLFEWRKLTGTNAGTTVIGRRPILALMYSSIQDTGTYQVRVYVPGSCYDQRSAYSVAPVAITCLPAVSGNILNDANGLNDNIVNGPGVTAGTLYVTLVDSTNKAVGVATVAADGTYFLLNVANGRYTAVLSTIAGVINAPAPAAQLPLPWVNTGEQIGTGAGSDGQVNGILTSIVVSGSAVNQLNFGMDQRPIANNVIAPVQSNPGGSNTVPVPPLNGADAEDGVYDGVSGINTIVIQTLPVNATLYYNGIAVVAGQIIQNYQPALLRIDPVDGTVVVTFTYSEVDAASVISIPALVTMVFRNFPLANADSAFTSQGAPVMMEVLANDDFGGDGPAANDIIITAAPMHGTASVINGGTTRNPVDDQILYTPANGYIGNDTLIYQICDSNGDCDTALVIIYIGLPVPVTLSNFTATPSGAEVLLGWQVQTAINVKEYVVLHSTDGIHYTAIGRQANRGTGQYQLPHPNPSNGMNYYQLKTVDEDGRITYSKIIALRFSATALNAAVWPNPFNNQINIGVQLQRACIVQASLYDAAGRMLRSCRINAVAGKNNIYMSAMQDLPGATYILRVVLANETRQFILVKR